VRLNIVIRLDHHNLHCDHTILRGVDKHININNRYCPDCPMFKSRTLTEYTRERFNRKNASYSSSEKKWGQYHLRCLKMVWRSLIALLKYWLNKRYNEALWNIVLCYAFMWNRYWIPDVVEFTPVHAFCYKYRKWFTINHISL